MKRRSLRMGLPVVVALFAVLHFAFNGRSSDRDGECVEAEGQLCLLNHRMFYHEGHTFAVVHAYLEYPHNRLDFTASAEEVARLEPFRGKRVRIVMTAHDGRNGRLVSSEPVP